MHSLTAKEEEKNPLNTETRKQIFQLLNPFTGRDGSETSNVIFRYSGTTARTRPVSFIVVHQSGAKSGAHLML